MSPCSALVRRQRRGAGLTMPHHCSQHPHLGKGAKGISGILSHWKWTSAVDGWGQGAVGGAGGLSPLILLLCPFCQLWCGSLGCSHPVSRESEKVKNITLQPFPAPSSPVLEAGAPTFPASPAMWHHMPFQSGTLEMGSGGRAGKLGKLCRETGGTGLLELGEVGELGWGAWWEELGSWRDCAGYLGNWAVRAGRTGLNN